jgi:RNA polymerase sigma factor (sigma-70 family)
MGHVPRPKPISVPSFFAAILGHRADGEAPIRTDVPTGAAGGCCGIRPNTKTPVGKIPAGIVFLYEMTPRQLADLIAAHAAALVLFARQWCDCPEDVTQEAFCKLAGLRAPPTDPAAWLFRAARNAAIDAGRVSRRRAKREQSAARPEQWFAEADADGGEAAVAALLALPPDQREVIVARLWGGLTLEQVAAAAGCSISTAHRRYEAGIQALRERLGATCPK